MDKKIFEIGPIRPPSEAHSLLLRVTKGCTWNKCRFCDLYRDTKFHFYSIADIKETIDIISEYRDRILSFQPDGSKRPDHQKIMDDMKNFSQEQQNNYYMVYNWIVNGRESVFLQDANTMAIKPDYLIEILEYLKEKLPEIKRITSYGRADSLARIETVQYVRLRKAGLDRIHSGFESGSDEVLKLINKGITSAMQVQAGRRIMESGIQLSIYFMPGIGGKELSKKNAVETARVVNAVNPDFVRLRTCVIKEGSELWDLVQSGLFIPCTDIEKVMEIDLLLKNIKSCNGTLLSDHIINLLPEVVGRLDRDIDGMLNIIDGFLSLSEKEQRRFQLARRAGIATGISDLDRLNTDTIKQIDSIIAAVNDSGAWEDIINQYLINYI